MTIIVSVKAGLLGKEWLGRTIDHKFVKDLRRYNREIDPCGEDGEFHTFVIDGPLFKHRLKIVESGKILEDGYWFLDVSKFEVKEILSVHGKKKQIAHGGGEDVWLSLNHSADEFSLIRKPLMQSANKTI